MPRCSAFHAPLGMNGVGRHQSKPQCCASDGAGTGTDGADHADHQTSSAGNPMIGIRHGTEVVEALTEERCFIKIGRASCRDRVWQYVSISVVTGSLKKQKNETENVT